MARKLKTYQTSVSFFDLAIAAPSMKAALEAWGANSNLFHQGFAKEVDDPKVVAATLAKPGVLLRRPVGSSGPFKEHADLPEHLSSSETTDKPKKSHNRRRNNRPGRSTIKPPARPHWRTRKSRENARASTERKKPPL